MSGTDCGPEQNGLFDDFAPAEATASERSSSDAGARPDDASAAGAAPSDPGARSTMITALGEALAEEAPSPLRKRFTRLLARLEQRQRSFERWDAFVPRLIARVDTEDRPRSERFRALRLELVAQLDTLLELDGRRGGVPRRLEDTITEQLLDLVSALIEEEETPELLELYRRRTGHDLEAARRAEQAELVAQLADHLGMELDPDDLPSMEELIARAAALADEYEDALEADGARSGDEAAARHEPSPAPDASRQALRDLHRDLARRLHPDREPDPAKREEKNRLMQRANDAAASGDLLELLTLQHELGRLEGEVLGELPEERFEAWAALLKRQLEALDERIAELAEPWRPSLPKRRSLTPANVERTFDAHLRELDENIEATEALLAGLADPATRREALETIAEPPDDHDDYLYW